MSSRDRQLVYCHHCDNEWYKDEHGLKCPNCQSEFVEELGGNEDPRADLRIPPDDYEEDPDISVPDEHPLHDHNPWAQHHDPAPHHHHDGVEGSTRPADGYRFTHMPGGFHVEMRRTFSPGASITPQAARGRSPDPMFDLQNNFFNMVNGIMGARAGARGGFATAGGGRGFGNVRVTTASFGGPGGATWSTQTLHPRDADGPQPGQPPVDDIHRLLTNTLFGAGGMGQGGHTGPFAHPFAGGPFAGLFGMMNPAGAQHGDAVFTQEALDRVISQLMEQNQMGNAPPPASQQDIEGLPKVKVTPEMADPKTGEADCSICMDTVPIGEEVTRLWCGHWFHGECVAAWLREHDSCPQCRKPIAQARDEAMGRSTSTPQTQSPAAPSGLTQEFEEGGISHEQPSSASNLDQSSGTVNPISPMPGAYGHQAGGTPPAPGQRDRSASQRGQSQSQSPSQGFADRVRGLFGRGAGT